MWTLNEVQVPTTGNERISTDEISLIFSPLTTSDSGVYTCTLNITSLTQYVAIIGGVTMAEMKINLQSKLFVPKLLFISFTQFPHLKLLSLWVVLVPCMLVLPSHFCVM